MYWFNVTRDFCVLGEADIQWQNHSPRRSEIVWGRYLWQVHRPLFGPKGPARRGCTSCAGWCGDTAASTDQASACRAGLSHALFPPAGKHPLSVLVVRSFLLAVLHHVVDDVTRLPHCTVCGKCGQHGVSLKTVQLCQWKSWAFSRSRKKKTKHYMSV